MAPVTKPNRTAHPLRAMLHALPAVLLLALAGCAGDEEDVYLAREVEPLYNEAVSELNKENYQAAAKLFDEVERQHPYSVWATKSQLYAAYAHYQTNEYAKAVLSAERFIQLHPGNPDAAYAHYLIAMSYYEQISDVGRDQRFTELALRALEEVSRRYPGTEYARDARLKIDLTRDHLAGKEMEVGRYYELRGHYLSAINRFRVVIEKYQTTSHTPEALHRLVECYLALGVTDEAQAVAAVLGHNYPGSRWYEDSYALLTREQLAPLADNRSWVSRAMQGVL